jgi:hypothetical protein
LFNDSTHLLSDSMPLVPRRPDSALSFFYYRSHSTTTVNWPIALLLDSSSNLFLVSSDQGGAGTYAMTKWDSNHKLIWAM